MLFNTLANLRVLISTDPERATVMLDHMIAYLRATLGGSRAVMHPLQLEFDRLRDYLALMTIRMGSRLRYTLDLPPELANHPVPPLLLQPLVENAVRHGVEFSPHGADVRISTQRRGDVVVIKVTNTVPNGQGVAGHGLALRNVRERLALLHDVQSQFRSGLQDGVHQVRIEVPL